MRCSSASARPPTRHCEPNVKPQIHFFFPRGHPAFPASMNAFSRQLFRGLAATLVSALALSLTSFAQPAPAEKSTPLAGQTPPAATAPDATPTPAPNTPPTTENQKDDKSNLRRLDQPQPDATVPSSTEPARRDRRRRGSNSGEF